MKVDGPGNQLVVRKMSQHKARELGYPDTPEDLLIPRPSIILPQLQEDEKKFFELVHSCNINAVTEFLLERPNFKINCVNFQGVSALLIAVKSGSEKMVEFLLNEDNIEIGDCILHAVKDNQPKILERLLDRAALISPSMEFIGVTNSSDFPDHITPLILAAQTGNYEIIQLLINRGHLISKPHSAACRCIECLNELLRDDHLHAETFRLNLYRAVTNPAYICHSTHDPILTAFKLSKELRENSFLIPEFREAYLELAEEISDFAGDLIGCCRSTEEVKVVLRQESGLEKENLFIYPRLLLALDLKQKKFIVHPNTQQILEAAWSEDWHEFKIKPTLSVYATPFIRLIQVPFIFCLCFAAPNSNLVQHWNIPLNKMITHAALYFVFLVIIFLQSNADKKTQKRLPPNTGLEIVIVLFVFGYIWNSIRMCFIVGVKRYFSSLWNWHAVITNLLFFLTFAFWLAAYIDSKHHDQVNLERKYWSYSDAVLLAEGTFAIATIMAFFKLMYFCRLNYYLGPLQISLGKMCSDMAKYFTIFTIIILAFTAGTCRLYQYYDSMVQIDSNGIKTQQVTSFINFGSTLKTYFWALLCMAPLESADVIIENLPGSSANATIINKHEFTEAIGYVAFAIFELLTVVMILNMLIATMTSTFQRVIDNLDTEWRFGKTYFYVEYMMQSTLSSPLNLLPTPAGVRLFLSWYKTTSFRNLFKSKTAQYMDVEQKVNKEAETNENEYLWLMSQLVQRYFREKDNGQVDIQTLKYYIKGYKNHILQTYEL